MSWTEPVNEPAPAPGISSGTGSGSGAFTVRHTPANHSYPWSSQ